jgi:putative ABC transport system ATP-binding protein
MLRGCSTLPVCIVSDPVIEAQDLVFRWPSARQPTLCLPHWSLTRGERVFVHGPSGSGKSTWLSLIAGVLTPTSGSLKVLGQDLAQLQPTGRDRFRADHLGVVFQQFNLLPWLSGLDNVTLSCTFSASRRARAQPLMSNACHLLAELGLTPSEWQRPAAQLSVGQQQRVALARALVGRPELILADEPTSALDADHQARFLSLLLDQCQAQGTSLIFVSHDLRLQSHFDRTQTLSAGAPS